jgi:hypothetical protein
VFVVLPGGADDDSARVGMAVRHACCSRAARSLRAWLGQHGSGVLLVFCPVDDSCSAVEVGSSCMAAELLSPIPVLSCISTL